MRSARPATPGRSARAAPGRRSSSSRVTPGSTTATWFSGSISLIARMRSKAIRMPSGTGRQPPESPVPLPRVTTGTRIWLAVRRMSATSAVVAGRTTAPRCDGPGRQGLVVGVVGVDLRPRTRAPTPGCADHLCRSVRQHRSALLAAAAVGAPAAGAARPPGPRRPRPRSAPPPWSAGRSSAQWAPATGWRCGSAPTPTIPARPRPRTSCTTAPPRPGSGPRRAGGAPRRPRPSCGPRPAASGPRSGR